MSLNRQNYQAFATLLQQLGDYTTTAEVNAPELRRMVASLQQMFRQQIVPDSESDSRVQSYQKEISKQLRLLELDVTFFQGAKQVTTTQARLQTIGDRLSTLIQYCEAILQLGD